MFFDKTMLDNNTTNLLNIKFAKSIYYRIETNKQELFQKHQVLHFWAARVLPHSKCGNVNLRTFRIFQKVRKAIYMLFLNKPKNVIKGI